MIHHTVEQPIENGIETNISGTIESGPTQQQIYWWRALANSFWNLLANYKTTEGGAVGFSSLPFAGDNVYFSDAASDTTCEINVNAACKSISTRTAETGGTNNWSGTLLIDALSKLTVQQGLILDGVGPAAADKMKLNMAAGAYLQFGSILVASANVLMTLTTTSWIISSGNITIANAAILAVTNTGVLFMIASGIIANPSASNYFYDIYILNGVVATASGTVRWNAGSSGSFFLAGTIAAGANSQHVGAGAAGAFIIDAGADITGSGSIFYRIRQGAITSNAHGSFSSTGIHTFINDSNGVTNQIPTWDILGNNARLQGPSSAITSTLRGQSGTLLCKSLICFLNFVGATLIVDNSVNNTNYYVNGNFSLKITLGTLTYTRGTGIIEIAGGNSNIEGEGKSVEILIISGTTKTVVSAFSTVAMLVTGTLDLNNIATVVVEGDLFGDGTISSPGPVILTVNGTNNFIGTLTNVTIV